MTTENPHRKPNFIVRIFRWYVRFWKFTVPATLALIGVAIWLIFFYFAFHLIFIDDRVNEDQFVFASGAVVDMRDEDEREADREDDSTSTTQAPAPAQSEVVQAPPAEFMRRTHPASGQAFLISDGNQIIVRFEDLRTDNGPDLDVYLVPFPGDADRNLYDSDFINLGDLKGNIGDQFYEIPAGTDLTRYTTIVIWCVRFRVAFGTVELNPLPQASA